MKPAGEPDAVAPQVRFDERRWETGRWPQAPSYRAHLRLYHLDGGLRSAFGLVRTSRICSARRRGYAAAVSIAMKQSSFENSGNCAGKAVCTLLTKAIGSKAKSGGRKLMPAFRASFTFCSDIRYVSLYYGTWFWN